MIEKYYQIEFKNQNGEWYHNPYSKFTNYDEAMERLLVELCVDDAEHGGPCEARIVDVVETRTVRRRYSQDRQRGVTTMRLFRGKTKAKKETPVSWVKSSTGKRWHRLDPNNGRRTACGIPVNDIAWSFPGEIEPPEDLICKWPQCRGVVVDEA